MKNEINEIQWLYIPMILYIKLETGLNIDISNCNTKNNTSMFNLLKYKIKVGDKTTAFFSIK